MTAPYTGTMDDLERRRRQLEELANPPGGEMADGAPAAGVAALPAVPGPPAPQYLANESVLPSGVVPAPPPAPPPAPAGLEDLTQQTIGAAGDWLTQTNPYLSPLVQATRQSGEAQLAEQERQATRGIEEWAAQRGLVGSSYEGEQMVDLQGELQRAGHDGD
jgi:hypothetical protein